MAQRDKMRELGRVEPLIATEKDIKTDVQQCIETHLRLNEDQSKLMEEKVQQIIREAIQDRQNKEVHSDNVKLATLYAVKEIHNVFIENIKGSAKGSKKWDLDPPEAIAYATQTMTRFVKSAYLLMADETTHIRERLVRKEYQNAFQTFITEANRITDAMSQMEMYTVAMLDEIPKNWKEHAIVQSRSWFREPISDTTTAWYEVKLEQIQEVGKAAKAQNPAVRY